MTRRRAQPLFGLSGAEAELLIDRARARLGPRAFRLRAAAFLLATAPIVRHAIPQALRRRAIRPFAWSLLPGPAENLLYVAPDRYGLDRSGS